MCDPRRQLLAGLLAIVILPSTAVPRSQTPAPKPSVQQRHTLDEYVTLGERFRSGDTRRAVALLRSWDWRRFRDFREALHDERRQLELAPHLIREKWDRVAIEALAALHTEAAIACEPLSTEEASHANWARQLLALFDGLDVDQTFRRRWHVAWGAHLQSSLRLRELSEHLHGALGKWPKDPDLLTMAGSVYESWSHPAVLLHLGTDYIPQQIRLRHEWPERRKSRRLAEEYYRRALVQEPGRFDAHLRLGRMLLEARRLDDAENELTQAANLANTARQQYLARIFMGRLYSAARRWSDALAAYGEADRLLPGCQTPGLASSYALLRNGSRDAARDQVKATIGRSHFSLCEDPWWEYEFGFGPRANELLEELRARLRR